MRTASAFLYSTLCVQCLKRVACMGTGNPVAATSPWASADGVICPAGPFPAHQPHPVWIPEPAPDRCPQAST